MWCSKGSRDLVVMPDPRPILQVAWRSLRLLGLFGVGHHFSLSRPIQAVIMLPEEGKKIVWP